MTNQTSAQIHDIITRIASIQSMDRGKLSEVYRESKRGRTTVRLGPYYKLQVWENGKNCTRHVPSEEVEILKKDLANHGEFSRLVNSLEETIISHTRKLRAESKPAGVTGAKKTPPRSPP